MVRLVTDFLVSSLKYIDHFGGGTHGQIDRTTEEPSLHVSSPETVPASRLYPGWSDNNAAKENGHESSSGCLSQYGVGHLSLWLVTIECIYKII